MQQEPRTPTAHTDPHPQSADTTAEDMQFFRRVLRHMVELGDALTDVVVQEATPATTQSATVAYERVTTSIRRSIMLYGKIIAPKKPLRSRVAARKRIIREVEDAIHSKAYGDHADALHAEMLERLDRPDLDDEIANRSIAEIVTDMCRDLGIAGLDGTHPWRRRMPHDIAILNARAEQRAGTAPSAELEALLASAPPAQHGPRLTAAIVAKMSDEEIERRLAALGHYNNSG
jgi:hypothetical protein